VGVFNLKYRDTRPVLEVALKNPDLTVHDLTGSSAWKLHIRLEDGARLVRDMVPDGNLALGMLRYTWIAGDWNVGSSLDTDGSYQVGGLEAGPAIPIVAGTREHQMEFEVVGPAGARLTFPNGLPGYDTLRIITDIGQG